MQAIETTAVLEDPQHLRLVSHNTDKFSRVPDLHWEDWQ